MNNKILFFSLFSFLVFLQSYMSAVTKGSTTAVSIEPYFTFPESDSGNNAMIGFGWFKNGFGLESATTTCTFDSVYPVSGSINMNGGTLELNQDLDIRSPIALEGLGSIIGNGNTIHLCSEISQLPADLILLQDINLIYDGSLELQSTVSIEGTCVIQGSGDSYFIMDPGAELIVDSGAHLKIANLHLKDVGNNNILCVDNTGSITLNNIVWCQSGDMTFANGSLLLQNTVDFIGSTTFSYESALTSTIDCCSSWVFDGGITFRIGRQTLGGAEPLYFTKADSVLSFGECSLVATENGIMLSRGKVEFSDLATIEALSSDSTKGIILGDGISQENDITIYLGPGSSTDFKAGALVYNNVVSNRFYATSQSAYFIREQNSIFYMATNCIYPSSTLLFVFDGDPAHFPQTILLDGVELTYNNSLVTLPGYGSGIFNARRTGGYSFVLDNNGSIYLTNGSFEGGVNINGSNTMLSGNGNFVGQISFTDSNGLLMIALAGSIGNTMALNGGTVLLGNRIIFTQPNCFTSGGTINLDQYEFVFDFQEEGNVKAFPLSVPLHWVGNNGFITFYDNISLSSTWTISGNCTIWGDGSDSIMFFADGGEIVVDSNAHLTLKDLKLTDLSASKIRCVDNNGVITLDTVVWEQTGDFIFDTGSLEFKNQIQMIGNGNTFSYVSTQTSIIDSFSTLQMDYDLTFSYAPVDSSADLLGMQDETSTLILNGVVLSIPSSGLNLVKGKIIISQNSSINGQIDYDADGNSINAGLTLGDGTAPNDTVLLFSGDKAMSVSGALNYNNSNPESLVMCLDSQIVIAPNSWLRVYQSMNLGNGTMVFNQNSVYAHVLGIQLIGSVQAAGQFSTTIV